MKVDVEVERATEALDQGDGARLCRLVRKPGFSDQMRGQYAIDDAQHLAHDRRTAGEQKPQWQREAQHPLAHRGLGQDVVYQQRRALRHAPGSATGAEAAALAAEGHEMFRMAAIAAHPQEPVLKPPALQVILELLRDMPRQCAALVRQMGLELMVLLPAIGS